MSDQKLRRAIVETKDHPAINREYDDDEPHDEDAIEDLIIECCQARDLDCCLTRFKPCDFEY